MFKKLLVLSLVVIISLPLVAEVEIYRHRLEEALWQLQEIDPVFIEEKLNQAEKLSSSSDWEDQVAAKTILEKIEPLFTDTRAVETRCMWVDYVTFGNFFSRSDIVRLLDKLALLDIHILFPEVYAYGTTIYPSKIAKIQDQYLYLFEDGDILKIFIEEAHQRGMEVHPLVRVFSSGYKNPGYLINKHPEWLEVTRDGTRGSSNSYFISPTIPEFRRYLEAVMTELVTNYDIDGLHLDYIRYEDGDFGYSEASRNLYKKLYFKDPLDFLPGSRDEEFFKDFRRAHVDAFVRWCYKNLKAIKPELLISAAVGSPYSWDYKSLFQDWVYWSKEGYIDFVTPMQYRDTTPKFKVALEEDINANQVFLPLFSGLGLYLFNDVELQNQIEEVRRQNLPGVALFSEANMSVVKYFRIKDGVFRNKAFPVHRHPEKAIDIYLEDLCFRIQKNSTYLGIEEEEIENWLELIVSSRGTKKIIASKYLKMVKAINERLVYVQTIKKYYHLSP